MPNELAIYTMPTPAEWQHTIDLVDRVANTEFVPYQMRGKPAAVLASVMTGRELGIGPMQSMKHIRPVQGTPGLSAELMSGLVRRAGHKIRPITRSLTEAEVEGIRADDPQHPLRVRWTLQDAVRAKLCTLDKDGHPIARSHKGEPLPWELYPQAQLFARATSALCRAMFSDVLAGFGYTPEELESIDGSTEATWGEVEVDRQTGEVIQDSPGPAVTPIPTGPGDATPNLEPWLSAIDEVNGAKALCKQHPPLWAAAKAFLKAHDIDPDSWWKHCTDPDEWRNVLVAASQSIQPSTAAGGTQSSPSGSGKQPPAAVPEGDQTNEETADADA
jgi:hypothetical protein